MIPVFCQRLIAAMIVMCWSVACHKPVEPTYSDNRGRKIADLPSLYSILGWSADSRELYYLNHISFTTVDAGNYRLYALDIQTGTSRLIYDGPGGRNLSPAISRDFFQSPDGQYLYLMAKGRQQPGYSLYRINPRQLNQAVAIDSSYDQRYPTNPYTPATVVAANGNWLSFQYRPDSTRIHNLTNRSSFRLPSASVIAFSPDAGQVLLRQTNNPLYRSLKLADLSGEPVDLAIPASQLMQPERPHYPNSDEIRWHPQGIRYVYGEFFGTSSAPATIHLFLWNATQRKSTKFYSVPDGERGATRWVWSRAGERVAFTSGSNALFRDLLNNAIVYVTNLTTLTTRSVAAITFGKDEGGIRGMFISPDNTSLVYYIGNKVYVAPI